MFRNSISRLIISLQSLLLIGFVSVTGVLAFISWHDSDNASEILNATRADQLLFSAVLGVRQQISGTQTALVSQDDPTGAFARTRAIADQSFDTAMAALEDVEVDGVDKYISDLQAAWAEQNRLEENIDALAKRPKDQRSVPEVKEWSDSVRNVVDTILGVSLAVGNDVRLLDPFVGEMIQVRRAAWMVRDKFGSQCSLLRPNVSKNEPLSPESFARWNQLKGGYQLMWDEIDSVMARPGIPQRLLNEVKAAESATTSAQTQLDALYTGLNGGTAPAMPPTEYTALCNGPFDQIVEIGHTAMKEAVLSAESKKASANIGLVTVSIGLVIALGLSAIAIASVLRRFSTPIGHLMADVERLSHADYKTKVTETGTPDELGRLAEALEELRKNALQTEELRQAQQKAQQEQIEKGKKLAEAVSAFEQGSARIVQAVRHASGDMQGNAEQLSTIAENTDQRTQVVAKASGEASGNVQTVAAASEELSASIIEVNQQINGSSRMANDAVDEVEQTNQSFSDLKEAAEKIGEVVELIQNIASQTNLLALNATIEAARAGDAGKGFAVVANEVKTLATQTHKATEEISGQIGGMQTAVGLCIEAITGIGTKIHTINEAISAIAAATEEQSSATQEIARNVQHAATGTSEVSDNIASVTEMARDTRQMSAEVLKASSELSSQADALGREVEEFLSRVRGI
ncbi:methyl-accepting chemotaxis protein [Thalassospira xiamenensis]|uniref:methyl-accepting chemotaxis protein n=1 Tax=Thalassospira xiamenensis TaxID=220697 RepID=UPI003AA80924